MGFNPEQEYLNKAVPPNAELLCSIRLNLLEISPVFLPQTLPELFGPESSDAV